MLSQSMKDSLFPWGVLDVKTIMADTANTAASAAVTIAKVFLFICHYYLSADITAGLAEYVLIIKNLCQAEATFAPTIYSVADISADISIGNLARRCVHLAHSVLSPPASVSCR